MKTLLWPLPNNVLMSLHHCCWEFYTLGTTTDPLPPATDALETGCCHHCQPVSQDLVFQYPRFTVSLAPDSISQGTASDRQSPTCKQGLENAHLPFSASMLEGRLCSFPKPIGQGFPQTQEGGLEPRERERERKKKTNVHSIISVKILVGRYSIHYGASLLSPQLSPSHVVKGCFTEKFMTLPKDCWSGHRSTWPAQQQATSVIELMAPAVVLALCMDKELSRLIPQLPCTSAGITLRHILILACRDLQGD